MNTSFGYKDFLAMIGFCLLAVLVMSCCVACCVLCCRVLFRASQPMQGDKPPEPKNNPPKNLKKDKRCQSQTTYSAVRGVKQPRFEPLREHDTVVLDY